MDIFIRENFWNNTLEFGRYGLALKKMMNKVPIFEIVIFET